MAHFADFVVTAAKSAFKNTIQKEVIEKLTPVIQENLTNIDVLKNKIDIELGTYADTLKDKIPGTVREIMDATMVIDIVNSIDSSLFTTEFNKIIDSMTTETITATGSTKEVLKTSIGGLPDDIKEIFIKHINSVFSKGTTATSSNETTTSPKGISETPPAAVQEAPAAAVVQEAPAPAEQEKLLKQNEGSIEEGLSNMPNDDKKETIDKIMKMLEDTGILDEIKKRICTAPPAPPAVAAPLPPTPPAGGANKKHRRKTKKNIRRQKRTYTKFGREF